jgi:DNA polymerase III alpha subunit
MDQLKQRCEAHLAVMFDDQDRPWYDQRLRQELRTIQTNGHAGGFEEAEGTVRALRNQGVYCRLAGAGCSSLVSYLMNLSEIDPVQHGLPYERFLEASSSKLLQFRFVVYQPTNESEGYSTRIETESPNRIVGFQQSNFLDAIPFWVTQEVRRTDLGFDLNSIPWDDETAFNVLQSGNVEGISQFDESRGAQLLLELKPRSLIDIAAITATQLGELHEFGIVGEYIRRGSSRGPKNPENWQVDEALQETRGMILFQEQIMLIMNRVADISLGDAYSFIKTVCKRQWEPMAITRELFLIGAEQNGMEESSARRLFDELRDAATRAVCKSHHLSEAVTTYRAAFLKARFPSEFARVLQTIPQ